jgi:hypothetical protein
LLLSTKANALTIGTGLIHTKNDKIVKQEYKPSLTIGDVCEYKKINVAVSTNRLFSSSNNIELKNGLKIKQRTKFDALQLGYRINRFIPAVFVANVRIDRKFLNIRTQNSLVVYGASINYLLTKNLSFGVGGTTKNEEGQSFFTNLTYRL